MTVHCLLIVELLVHASLVLLFAIVLLAVALVEQVVLL